MDIFERLRDPCLVADIQHYFGVRRKEDGKSYYPPDDETIATTHTNDNSTSTNCTLLDRYLQQQQLKSTQNKTLTLDEKQQQIENISGLEPRHRSNQLTVPEVDCKTHIRQGSTASDTSGEWGKSWMGSLLGENTGGTEGSMEEDNTLSESDVEEVSYTIHNRLWYHLFFFATSLGGELFYSVFFCFWAWNIDGAVLRRVIVIWMITMYIGQAMKDVLKVPRPSAPPVIRLDPRWQLEYGLPSTHAMVGAAMPFSVLILSLERYQLDWMVGLAIALVWCACVCFSRLYLGMHSVLDVLCGLLLVSILLCVLLPWVDVLDHLTLTHPASPALSITLTLAMVVCYPATDRWTPARGDTTVIVGVGCGSLLGSWLNYQTGVIREPSLPPPYTIIWPSLNMVGLTLLRTILGLVVIVAVKAIFKSLSFATICALLQVRAEDYVNKTGTLTSRHRLVVELFYKFITYIAIGFTVVYTAPMAFRLIGIERPTFYTEV
ncbi:hypothetical protein Pmani_034442 [Petrolisthes manimaculis]|uniref:Phosphatidic acid phosphatase type 2/haloperoxidase domain-containing protein n=1 Tax=Petrolisthes manimaculis TaxID=1843537 RepID=A0AAE1NMJ1_9EUCA|nr:hypothetical protein Pmani_034442 [Petrolisthes manimaculis]